MLVTEAQSLSLVDVVSRDKREFDDTLSKADVLGIPGVEVIEAVDGRDALVKSFAERPALIVTETRLPMLDGYALCEVLRHDASTRGIPILVVTSENRLATLERARGIGVDALLNKPVTPEILLDEIRRLLQEAPRSRASIHAPLLPPEQKRRTMAKAHLYMRTTTPPVQTFRIGLSLLRPSDDLQTESCWRRLYSSGRAVGHLQLPRRLRTI